MLQFKNCNFSKDSNPCQPFQFSKLMLCLAGSQSVQFSTISERIANKDSPIHLVEERHSEMVVEFCNYTGSGIDAVNLRVFLTQGERFGWNKNLRNFPFVAHIARVMYQSIPGGTILP